MVVYKHQPLNESGRREHQSDDNLVNEAVSRNQALQLPPLSLVDMEVIENLPREVLSEMDKMYNGRLFDYIAKKKGSYSCITSHSVISALYIF